MPRGERRVGQPGSSRVLRPEDLPPEVLEQLGIDAKKKRPPKYHNRRVVVDGVAFDSQKEATRWGELVLLRDAGLIQDLRRQVRYKLTVNCVLITTYICDFAYELDGRIVAEDVKGMVLPIFMIKKRLMKACLGIDVKII